VFKGLVDKNGTVPLGDRFFCENYLLSILKRKEKGHLYVLVLGVHESDLLVAQFDTE